MEWKSLASAKLESLDLQLRLPRGWDVDVRTGASGMPSVVVASRALPDGRRIVGHIQAELRGGARPPELAYFLGISVPTDDENYPEPSRAEAAPGWVAHLKTLHDGVLKGREDALLVSTHAPQSGGSALGARKLPLAEKFLPDHPRWLVKGYTDDWGLGIRSQKVELDDAEYLAEPFVTILTQWYELEAEQEG